MSFVANIQQIVPVIAVANVKDAIDWYQRALGFKAGFINRDAADETGETWNYALLDNNGAQLHLAKIVSDDATLSSPCNCYLFVENIFALHEHLTTLQADVTPLQAMPWGNLECWLHDPYGNRLVLSAEE
ncbi:Glyoxalase-like domain protein [Symmachiella macrocystis]|uniref:Glyoxalase-like domain protein n=1 Tax=Symmachiella macrocystis TaxID=2527985 RepID=A0A5C6BEG4_9PLAN|nr:VOC family protein [Symmachiella macrocystis]TWU09669.1 Glyoxalase-like domain protein [Symmachiella macrocystis]